MKRLLASLILLGCHSPEEGSIVGPDPALEADGNVEISRVGHEHVESLEPDQKLVIDTTATEHVVVLDASFSHEDARRVDLICPNGEGMVLADWLDERISDGLIRPDALEVSILAMGADADNTAMAMQQWLDSPDGACACSMHCEPCDDGLTLCQPMCPCGAPATVLAGPVVTPNGPGANATNSGAYVHVDESESRYHHKTTTPASPIPAGKGAGPDPSPQGGSYSSGSGSSGGSGSGNSSSSGGSAANPGW